MTSEKYEILPITNKENIKKQEWSYLYVFNIRTLRDVFVYCALRGRIDEKKLYKDMEAYKIPPPKDHWVNIRRKREERLRLEYIHAAEYLGFIKRENGKVYPNYDEFKKEKTIIKNENRNRLFNKGEPSSQLTLKEKKALLEIVFNYERARDFLRWFLDFSKFPNSLSFSIEDFKEEAEPIFILSKLEKGKKGSLIIKRDMDGELWKIPGDYIRLATYVFPNWFMELGIIDRVRVFPSYSEDNKMWDMYYPIKMSEKKFLKKNLGKILQNLFLIKREQKIVTIRIPFLLYKLAKKFNCPIRSIKKGIEKIYKEDFKHFYLERTSLQLMKKQSMKDKDSYIKVDGFYRSSLKIIKRGE